MVPRAFLHLFDVFLGEFLPLAHVPEEYHSFTYALRRLQAYLAFKHKYACQEKKEEGQLRIEAFLQPLEVVTGQGAYKKVFDIFKQCHSQVFDLCALRDEYHIPDYFPYKPPWIRLPSAAGFILMASVCIYIVSAVDDLDGGPLRLHFPYLFRNSVGTHLHLL